MATIRFDGLTEAGERGSVYVEVDTLGRLQTSQVSSTGVSQEITSDGAAKVVGLATNTVRISAGETYITNPTQGFRILLKGTGTLTFTPNTAGAESRTITAAELTEMSFMIYGDWPIECSSVTAGTGMEILGYI